MNRRHFLLAAAAAPFALRDVTAALAAAAPLAFVTADTESHVAVVDLSAGAVMKRIETKPGPRSIERVGEVAVVAHTVAGAVSVLDGSGVRHVLRGFVEPRYTAAAHDGRHAFVTDSGRVELVTVDVVRGEVVARLKLRLWPRHLSLARDGRTLWVGLGTASPELMVVDVSDPRRPRLRGKVRPPFAAHDVGFYDRRRVHVLPADAAPQHVTFLDGCAFVTSGGDGTLRVYDERGARLLRTTRVPVGSYNVQFAAGRVITPSLNAGTLCVLDASGIGRERVRVADRRPRVHPQMRRAAPWARPARPKQFE